MPYSLASATPYRLHVRNLAIALVVFTLCDIGFVLKIPLCVFVSGVGYLLQPVLLSIWATVGRGSAFVRWSMACSLCIISWLMKVHASQMDVAIALWFGGLMVEHLLLFPVALAIGSSDWTTVNQDKGEPELRSDWQFSLGSLMVAITLLAMTFAALRAFPPFSLEGLFAERRTVHIAELFISIAAIFFAICTQAIVLLPLIWAVWGVELRIWSRRWDSWFVLVVIALLILDIAILGCPGLAVTLIAPLEIMLIGPAIILTRGEKAAGRLL
ncbi:MAG TPA: hypothetical protein VL096_05260 [Pirellulaceae bacterium]|nr:hypothetical protein [Pirellulaceae bacterium]